MTMSTRLLLTIVTLLLLTVPSVSGTRSKKRKRKSAADGTKELSSHTKATVMLAVGSSGEQSELQLKLPTRAAAKIETPGQLMSHVSHAWDVVVAPHQAGLSDSKAVANEAVPLGPEEAWHHFEASKRGVVDSARLLVAFSIVPSLQQQTGATPLHAAAARGDVDRIRALLDDENLQLEADTPSGDGTTALHAAAAMGHAAAVRLLLELGGSTEAAGRDGATPLMRAAAMGQAEAAVALLEGGAAVDAAHPFGRSTALHFAAEMGHEDIVRALCSKVRHIRDIRCVHVAYTLRTRYSRSAR